MSRDFITSALAIVMVGCCLANAILGYRVVHMSKELELLQLQSAELQRYQNAMNMLARDLVIYSQTHPNIDPILQSVNLKSTNNPARAAVGQAPKAGKK